jgi:hypothetical protein
MGLLPHEGASTSFDARVSVGNGEPRSARERYRQKVANPTGAEQLAALVQGVWQNFFGANETGAQTYPGVPQPASGSQPPSTQARFWHEVERAGQSTSVVQAS